MKEAKAEGSGRKKKSTAREGLAETMEQVQDDYFSGNNEGTFLRDGKDLTDE